MKRFEVKVTKIQSDADGINWTFYKVPATRLNGWFISYPKTEDREEAFVSLTVFRGKKIIKSLASERNRCFYANMEEAFAALRSVTNAEGWEVY